MFWLNSLRTSAPLSLLLACVRRAMSLFPANIIAFPETQAFGAAVGNQGKVGKEAFSKVVIIQGC